jgi:hypothetical protein
MKKNPTLLISKFFWPMWPIHNRWGATRDRVPASPATATATTTTAHALLSSPCPQASYVHHQLCVLPWLHVPIILGSH